jgi:hypothetical protein
MQFSHHHLCFYSCQTSFQFVVLAHCVQFIIIHCERLYFLHQSLLPMYRQHAFNLSNPQKFFYIIQPFELCVKQTCIYGLIMHTHGFDNIW